VCYKNPPFLAQLSFPSALLVLWRPASPSLPAGTAGRGQGLLRIPSYTLGRTACHRISLASCLKEILARLMGPKIGYFRLDPSEGYRRGAARGWRAAAISYAFLRRKTQATGRMCISRSWSLSEIHTIRPLTRELAASEPGENTRRSAAGACACDTGICISRHPAASRPPSPGPFLPTSRG